MDKPRLLYPAIIVAALSVTFFCALGIAALTGHIPNALSQSATPTAEADAGNPARSKAVCLNCGVVDSVRAVEAKGSGTGLGAVAGGVAGALVGNQIGAGNGRTAMTIIGGGAGAYAGNEIEKNVRHSTVWQVRVHMDDGSERTLTLHHQPELDAGSKVKIVGGQPVLRG